MRLAYFSPLNPAPSGISDYSEELLMPLAAFADITLVVDGYIPNNPEITARFAVVQDSAYASAQFDLALYHLGNSPAHGYIYRRALREPGVIVLHDLVLHHLVAWMTLNHGKRAEYIAAMRQAYGTRGAELAEREVLGLEGLNRFDYPLSEAPVQTARGVIVHSRYVANYVTQVAPQVPVAQIPHEIPIAPPISQVEARARLGLPSDALLVGSFGNVVPSKRVSVLLEAFRELHKQFPKVRLLFVGAASAEFDMAGLIELFALREAVVMTGHTDWETFQTYMAAMDVCVNLRYPTAGETSGAVLRMMAQGKPVIVSRVGWFAELPEAVAAQVDVDATEMELLRMTLARLMGDANLRAALGRNARSYVEQVCALEDSARAYGNFLEDVIANRATSRSYVREWKPPQGLLGVPPVTAPNLKAQTDAIELSEVETWKEGVVQACAALGLQEDRELRAVARAMVELGL